MTTYKFVVERHSEFGALGFRPTWYPEGEPLVGMTVAHDVLEHFPKDDGKAEGELMALGAALWIRGCGGYAFNGSPEKNIASDLPNVWGHHRYRDQRTTFRSCGVAHDAGVMEQARAAVRHARCEWRDRFDQDGPDEAARELMARWIAKGYQQARRRYKVLGVLRTCGMFQHIQEAADRALQYAEEGQVLTVQVQRRTGTVRVDCDYPRDDTY